MNETEKPKKKFQLNVKKSEHKIARILQITARILAGLGTFTGTGILGLFFTIFLMHGSIIGMIFFFLMFASVKFYTTSLKEELVGGILMICEAIGFILFLMLYAGWKSGLDLFIVLLITIPLVISGFLFITAWYVEKYKKNE